VYRPTPVALMENLVLWC